MVRASISLLSASVILCPSPIERTTLTLPALTGSSSGNKNRPYKSKAVPALTLPSFPERQLTLFIRLAALQNTTSPKRLFNTAFSMVSQSLTDCLTSPVGSFFFSAQFRYSSSVFLSAAVIPKLLATLSLKAIGFSRPSVSNGAAPSVQPSTTIISGPLITASSSNFNIASSARISVINFST